MQNSLVEGNDDLWCFDLVLPNTRECVLVSVCMHKCLCMLANHLL